MKKNLLIAFLLGAFGFGIANAQAGWEMVVAIARGSYARTTSVDVGTANDVALVPPDTKRPDLTCRNNSAFTIYIGTDSAGSTLTDHGFPILTNEVFEMDAFSDGVYAVAEGGTADVRCWEGKIR